MELALANLETFATTLLELARQNSDLLVVTSDSRGSANDGIDGPGLATTARQLLANH
jgi:hypothetical protein